jgi:hypothetical protein
MLLSRVSCCLAIIRCGHAILPRTWREIPSEAHVDVHTDPQGVTWPWRAFKTSSETPPNMTITGNGGELAPGYIFMTPIALNATAVPPLTKESAGFIMTSGGDLVFGHNLTGVNDYRMQYYNGKPYLTYWTGYNSQGVNVGHGYGEAVFLDDTYQNFTVNPNLGLNKLTTTANPNWSIDIHEQQMDSRNTLLVSAYNNTPADLSAVGGPADGWILDCLVFEIDIATQEVLFSWSALEHVPLQESKQPFTNTSGNGTEVAPWDFFHINAIELVDGNYLVNSRHTWSTFFVSGEDGSVIWRIQGETGGDFGPLPSNGTFRWQHFARAHNVTASSLDLALFDNHNQILDNGTTPTRGLVLHLELPPSKSYTPQVLRNIEVESQELYADSQGSYAASLSNGNQLMGYGQIPITREYGPGTDGSDLRWQAQFGGLGTVQSYRAFKLPWHATPAAWDPTLVVEDGQAYASWNGATEVTGWAVYVGSNSNSLRCVGVAQWKGFETVFTVPQGAAYLQVAAIQAGGEVRDSNVAQV